ncbi:MAG: c-type cytochrome [Bryobacteraceae bacterium]
MSASLLQELKRMRYCIVLLISTGVFAQVNPHTTAADVAAGARIFRLHCAECHGLHGEGGRGPNLTTGVYYHGAADANLFANITDGIPGTAMPSVFFSSDQVWQVVSYVRSLAKGASVNPPPGDRARGATLFRQKGCLGCHQVGREGGSGGPDLTLIGSQRSIEHLRQAILEPNAKVLRQYWVAKVTLENGATHAGFLMNEDTHTVQILDPVRGLQSLSKHDFRKFEIDQSSAMPSYRGKLAGSELNDLVAYLWTLKRLGRPE